MSPLGLEIIGTKTLGLNTKGTGTLGLDLRDQDYCSYNTHISDLRLKAQDSVLSWTHSNLNGNTSWSPTSPVVNLSRTVIPSHINIGHVNSNTFL